MSDERDEQMAIRVRSSGPPSPGPRGTKSFVRDFIADRYDLYEARAKRFRNLYYTTRLSAGVSAAAVPFLLGTLPREAMIASAVAALCIVVDAVFDPKTKWQLYSKAVDMLAIAELQRRGEVEEYEAALRVLLQTESTALGKLIDIGEIVSVAQKAQHASMHGRHNERPPR